MIKSIIIMVVSITLESIINLKIKSSSYLIPLFSLLSLIFIYKEFEYDRKNFYIFSFIFGIIYDLIFTNFYILNALLFLISSVIIYLCFSKVKYKLLNVILIFALLIIIYNLLLFLIFNIYNYNTYSLTDLIYILKHFFIGNLIYIILGYMLLKKINHNIR